MQKFRFLNYANDRNRTVHRTCVVHLKCTFHYRHLSTSVDANFVFSNLCPETLSLLKIKISCGKENISTKLFKEIMPNLISHVVHILNVSLKSGNITESYKCAKVYTYLQIRSLQILQISLLFSSIWI